MKNIINTRADLDAIAGTPAHAEFIACLKGSLVTKADVQTYPADYDRTLKPEDPGYLPPVLGEIEDNTTAAKYGFTRAELLAL